MWKSVSTNFGIVILMQTIRYSLCAIRGSTQSSSLTAAFEADETTGP